jgi:signal transduction histidine kinase
MVAENGRRALVPKHNRAARRGARLRALHEASLALAAPTPAEPQAVAALLGEIVERAVTAVDGRDGRLVLAEDHAWRELVPGQGQAAVGQGLIRVTHRPRPRRRAQADPALSRAESDDLATGLFRLRWRPDPATMHALATGETVIVPDTVAASRFGPYPQVAERGIGSFVLVPLQAGGCVLGALNISFERSAALSTEDDEILALFAGHAAAALDRLRLLHAERRRANQMEQLAAILARVGAAKDEERALQALLCGAVALLDGEYGVAYLFGTEEVTRHLMLRIDHGGIILDRSTDPAHLAKNHAAWIRAGGLASVVADCQELDPAAYALFEMMCHRGVRAAVNVPITAAGKLIGSLHVSHRTPGVFGAAELAAAEAVATQAGAAIERACLEAAREVAASQLARQREELAARAAEAAALQRMDYLKSELLGTISHELRTPLTVIHGYAQRLRLHSSVLDAATVATTATRIETSSARLRRLIEQLLDFSRLERGEVSLQVEDFDLVPALRDLLETLRLRPGGDNLVWHLPARMMVRADRDRLAQVVMNLVENAVKYAANGSITIRCRVVRHAAGGTSDAAPYVRLEVEDEGPGISTDQQQRIWEKFVRGGIAAEAHTVQGSGIGLAVVKALVEAQGGRVGVESTPGAGARFWFELPVPPSKRARSRSDGRQPAEERPAIASTSPAR